MYKPNFPFGVLILQIIAIAIIIFLIMKGCEYAHWTWKAMSATTKSPAIVLTEDVRIKIKGKDCCLPRGLVLYPLNRLECCPEVYDECEYKIYVSIDSLKFRKLTKSEVKGVTNLLYCVEAESE